MEPLGIAPHIAKEVIGCGTTKLYALLNDGELSSYMIGRSRRITTESIRAYVARRLAEQQEAA